MKPELGKVVVYCDSRGVDHDALITAVWSDTCINVIYVSSDATKQDSYGRQVERQTSCCYVSPSWPHGNYWRFVGEAKLPYTPPQQV